MQMVVPKNVIQNFQFDIREIKIRGVGRDPACKSTCRMEILESYSAFVRRNTNRRTKVYPYKEEVVRIALNWDTGKAANFAHENTFANKDAIFASYYGCSVEADQLLKELIDHPETYEDIYTVVGLVGQMVQRLLTDNELKIFKVTEGDHEHSFEVHIGSVFAIPVLLHFVLGLIRDSTELVLYGFADHIFKNKGDFVRTIRAGNLDEIRSMFFAEVLPVLKGFTKEYSNRRVCADTGAEALEMVCSKGAKKLLPVEKSLLDNYLPTDEFWGGWEEAALSLFTS